MNTVEPRYFELAYFELFASLNSSFFPYTLNQPRYFELVKNKSTYIRAQLETYCILFELEQNIQRFFNATASADLSDI